MKRSIVVGGLVLLAAACGPPPTQIAGTYSGQSSIVVSGTGDNQSASEFVTVTQNGGTIQLSVAQCAMDGYSDGTNSFHINEFKCQKFLTSTSWNLDITDGTLLSNASTLSLNAKGRATAGSQNQAVTFTFSGSRQGQ